MKTSHDFARELQRTVDFLLSKAETDFNDAHPCIIVSFYAEKQKFLSAVRTLGAGKKSVTSYDDFHYAPNGSALVLTINRNSVCRKVQDVKWECDPLLSDAEMETL